MRAKLASPNGKFEVQVRQVAIKSSLSLNSAVAMNVGGDTVSIFMSGYPDSNTSMPLRINGKPVPITNKSYQLSRGGVVRFNSNDIRVSWATGEQVIIHIFSSGKYKYLNVIPQIYSSGNIKYDGLLGNANGDPNDDLMSNDGKTLGTEPGYFRITELLEFGKISSSITKAKKMYQKKLTKNFGDSWRISNNNSLFDYKQGFSTSSYTDLGFPDDYLTLSQLNKEEIQNAQKVCEDTGVSGEDLQSCIYDVAFSDYNGFAKSTAMAVQTLDLLEEFGLNNPLKPLLPQNIKKTVEKESKQKLKEWLRKIKNRN